VLVGLPQLLLKVKDLAGLQSVEVLLLGQLLVKGTHGLLKLVLVVAHYELLSELCAIVGQV